MPGAQTPVSSFLSDCSLPGQFENCQEAALGSYPGFSLWSDFALRPRAARACGVSEARDSFCEGDDCCIDCLVGVVPVLGCLHRQVKGDDLFRAALLLTEILSLDLEPRKGLNVI